MEAKVDNEVSGFAPAFYSQWIAQSETRYEFGVYLVKMGKHQGKSAELASLSFETSSPRVFDLVLSTGVTKFFVFLTTKNSCDSFRVELKALRFLTQCPPYTPFQQTYAAKFQFRHKEENGI